MHNVSLPTHRYVWVLMAEITGECLYKPAVWFGVSSTPGRALGCHVLLENGAMVSDLPLHWLAHREHVQEPPQLEDCQAWDCFGYKMQLCEYSYLNLTTAHVLDPRHQSTDLYGYSWFSIDWVDNGWSSYPEQHKLLHLLACSDGSLRLLPTDRILWEDKSFTVIDGVPKIMRQTKEWSVE